MATINGHNKAMLEKEALKKKIKKMCDHRNRIKHACEFLKKHYNARFVLGTRQFIEEELQDPSKHWQGNKNDLICKGLNIKMFKAFLRTK